MSKSVYIDIDGVLYDLCGAIKVVLASRGITFYPENVSSWNFDGDIGCKKADVYSTFKDKSIYAGKHLYDGVVDSLQRLRNAGYRTVGYSSCVDNIDIFELRKKLFNVLGLEGEPHMSDGSGSKPYIDDEDCVAIFDDCIGIHEMWLSNNFKGYQYLISQPYTKEYNNPSLIKVASFNDAVDDFLTKEVLLV